MKKTKMGLRSLLIVLLVVSIGFVFIAGDVFALMRTALSNDQNVIGSGTLGIDLEVRQRDSGEYVSVIEDGNIPVFDYDNWEQGYTYVVNARIVNKGTLALAYEFEVVAEGILETMLENKPLLSDVIEVWYASDEVLMPTRADFDSAVDADKITYMGTLTQMLLSRTILKDTLLPIKNSTLDDTSCDNATFVLKMKDVVDAKYQGLKVGDETFKFNLLATQATHESDSFDNKYDISKQETLVFNDGQTHDVNSSVILTPDCAATDCIVADGAGTVVNIRGGNYNASSKDCAVWAKNGAVVNIYGGTFFCEGVDASLISVDPQVLIYAGEGGTINIYGGFFASASGDAWLLDAKDGTGGGTINVSGGTYKNWNPFDNISDGPDTNYLIPGTIVLPDTKGSVSFYSVTVKENGIKANKEGELVVLGSITVVDEPLYRNDNVTEDTVIQGNGSTLELTLSADNPLLYSVAPTNVTPALGTVFSSTTGAKTTVNDLTFTGTGYFIGAGDYQAGARNSTQTEFNNVKVIDMQILQFSKWPTALNTCGLATLNNCVVKGTTRSPLCEYYVEGSDTNDDAVLDLVVSNGSLTTINNGEYGRVYLDNSAKLEVYGAIVDRITTEARKGAKAYLKIGGTSQVKKVIAYSQVAGHSVTTNIPIAIEGSAVVDELDVTAIIKSNIGCVTVADTAQVKKVIDGTNVFNSVAEWKTWATANKA